MEVRLERTGISNDSSSYAMNIGIVPLAFALSCTLVSNGAYADLFHLRESVIPSSSPDDAQSCLFLWYTGARELNVH